MDTIVDVGCGTGTFLAIALRLGARAAYGIEGPWVSREMLDDPRVILHTQDLERPLSLHQADLAVSLEVAEHLSVGRAEGFVANLASCAPAILFSAALPGQGGVGHSNERWQSWWAALFASNGYEAYDVVRPKIWTDDKIPAWYRQNIILYLAPGIGARLGLSPTDIGLLDIVHPAFWERANRELKYANARPESEVLAEIAGSA
jgi:SAM-dependent methyltransferase